MSDRTDQQPGIERDVRMAVRAWTAQQERTLTGHPDSDALQAYQEGRLEGSEEGQVRDHVVICRACQRDLLALNAFDDTVADDSALLPSARDTHRSWQRFEQARAAEAGIPRAAADPPRWQLWGLLIAATIALALGAILLTKGFGDNATKPPPGDGRLADMGSPVVFGLTPNGSSVLRGAESRSQVVIPAGTGPLIPTLNLGDLTAYDRYFVEVYDETDQRLLHREGLARNQEGRITFLVARSEWPAGVWTVRLFGATDTGSGDTGSSELAAYTLQLRYDP